MGSGSYEQSWRAIPTQRPGPECYTRNRLKVQGSGKWQVHGDEEHGLVGESNRITVKISRTEAQL